MDFLVTNAPTIGLLLFFITFVVAAVWTYRPKAKKFYEDKAYIPMKEESNE